MSIRRGLGFLGCLGIAFISLATPSLGQRKEDLLFEEDFTALDHWDCFTRNGHEGSPDRQPIIQAQVREGCLILGTSAAGATLKQAVPRDVIIETELKVSTVKTNPSDPDPNVPGANIFVRKTEKDGLWHAYVVRLWFNNTPGQGYVIIAKHTHNFAEGKYVQDRRFIEKHWTLPLDTWYAVRVAVVDNQITVWIDGEEICTVTDAENLCPSGDLALSGFSWPSYAFFKRFRVLRDSNSG